MIKITSSHPSFPAWSRDAFMTWAPQRGFHPCVVVLETPTHSFSGYETNSFFLLFVFMQFADDVHETYREIPLRLTLLCAPFILNYKSFQESWRVKTSQV